METERPDFRSERSKRPDGGRGQTNKMTDEKMFSCVLQEFVPLCCQIK